MTIVTLTMNPTIALNTAVKQVTADQKLRCKEPEMEPGGGGINVSRAIRNLGGKSIAVFPAGGPNGELLNDLLSDEKINFSIIPSAEATRMNINISDESAEKQYRFIMPGPKLKKKEWEQCLDKIRDLNKKPEFIIISGSLPPGIPDEFFLKAAKLGKQVNAKVIIDSKKISLSALMENGIFLIKPNLKEFQTLAGKELKGDSEIEKAAKKIINEGGIEVIVISLGSGGAFLITKDKFIHFRSPAVPVKSKVGAGDSMTGGIVYSLSEGSSLTDAVKYGVAAGAAAVMTPGTELCRKEDTERLFNEKLNYTG